MDRLEELWLMIPGNGQAKQGLAIAAVGRHPLLIVSAGGGPGPALAEIARALTLNVTVLTVRYEVVTPPTDYRGEADLWVCTRTPTAGERAQAPWGERWASFLMRVHAGRVADTPRQIDVHGYSFMDWVIRHHQLPEERVAVLGAVVNSVSRLCRVSTVVTVEHVAVAARFFLPKG